MSFYWHPICGISVAVAMTTLCAAGGHCQEPKRYPIPVDCIQPENGHCYIASMDFGEEGDKFTGNQSLLILFEDGKPLGPGKSVHQEIRDKGQGRFSHWTREGLYMSASDNSDPRKNGRVYEVASTNPKSTLGGLAQFEGQRKTHVEEISSSRHEYAIEMGGTLDMENTTTVACSNYQVRFQPNLSLTIENTGDRPVVNPRLVINDRGNWYTFDSLLEEFTRGATTDQEKVYFIWQSMRENLYHESPLFGDEEPHDPVKLFNVYGLNLCDDAGNVGCSLFYHAGFEKSKNRALHGHVQCEAFIDGDYQFMDIDMDAFYLDRENEFPVSGDACARDHDLVRRELNYGPVVSSFVPSEGPAALFGPDDGEAFPHLRGHEIAYVLRPGEKALFRWDNLGKYCCENEERAHRPKFFGNSKFLYQPRLDLRSVQADAAVASHLTEPTAPDQGGKLAAEGGDASLVYEMKLAYAACGGTVRAEFLGLDPRDRFELALSLDGENWASLWKGQGAGAHEAEVDLSEALDIHNKPPKYRYFLGVGLGSATDARGAHLCALEIETDVMAAPVSLPRLRLGTNRVVYWDATEGEHAVRITHEWQETDAVTPLDAPAAPTYPQPGAEIRDAIVTFSWPQVAEADRYHLQVSRRPDFRFPYRTSLDVIIPGTQWCEPFTGIFGPETTYYWRLRSGDPWGVWGPWSEAWTFTWRGPRVPVHVRGEQDGRTITLHWEANPGDRQQSPGERPVRYEVYGSDEKGFSTSKEPYVSYTRGQVPGNLLGETTETSMVVVSPDPQHENMNKVYYRVVAVDANGTPSGCSDYAEMPHPFIHTDPVTTARAGQAYRYEVGSLRSLNDVQHHYEEPGNQFWDIEQNQFALVEGPAWLQMEEATGVLSGTPAVGDVGPARVRIAVTNQFEGHAEQDFELTVAQ